MLPSASSNPSPKLVVGVSVAMCLALIGSGLVTFALGPFPPRGNASVAFAESVDEPEAAPVCRNIFDDTGSLCASQPLPPEPIPTELPWCENLPDLVGVVHGDEHSYALFDQIGPKTTGEMAREATVIAIHGEEVWLVTTSSRCRLALFDPETQQPVQLAPELPSDDVVIRAEGSTMIVPDDLVDRLMSDPSALAGVRMVSTGDAFRIFGIRRGSLLYRAGIRAGDTIAQIGAVPIGSTEDLLTAYGRYSGARDLSVVLERDGVPTTLRFAKR